MTPRVAILMFRSSSWLLINTPCIAYITRTVVNDSSHCLHSTNLTVRPIYVLGDSLLLYSHCRRCLRRSYRHWPPTLCWHINNVVSFHSKILNTKYWCPMLLWPPTGCQYQLKPFECRAKMRCTIWWWGMRVGLSQYLQPQRRRRTPTTTTTAVYSIKQVTGRRNSSWCCSLIHLTAQSIKCSLRNTQFIGFRISKIHWWHLLNCWCCCCCCCYCCWCNQSLSLSLLIYDNSYTADQGNNCILD